MGFSPLSSVLREEMGHLHLETMGRRLERIIQDLRCLQEGQTIFSTWLDVFTQQIYTFVLSRAQEWNWRGNGTVRQSYRRWILPA